MTIESDLELQGLQKIGRIVGQTLQALLKSVRAGVTTAELDDQAGRLLAAAGARPAPVLTYRFPGNTCISINNVAAHGIPGDTVIQPGDLVNVDVSAELDGYFADTDATLVVPPVSQEAERLCKVTRATLWKVIHALHAGLPMNTVGRIVEGEAARNDIRVVRELTGHGVGRSLHDEPGSVYNFYHPRRAGAIRATGACSPRAWCWPPLPGGGHRADPLAGQRAHPPGTRWLDAAHPGPQPGGPARGGVAQFEHTIVITRGQPIIITAA